MLRFLLPVVVFLLLPPAHSAGAADVIDLTGINGVVKIGPALRHKLEQDTLPAQFKAKRRMYRLIVKLRAKESSAEFGRSFSTKSGNKPTHPTPA